MTASYKTWADAEVLVAADVNNLLMRQVTIGVDSQAERDAIAAPFNGVAVYRRDLSAVQRFHGPTATWRTDGEAAHAYVRASAARTGLALSTWHDVPLDSIVDASGPQPWTISPTAGSPALNWPVTITEAGLYRLESCTSMTVSGFAVRVYNSTTSKVLVQGSVSQGASITNSIAGTRRIAAGNAIRLQVYSTGPTDIKADDALIPTFLSITKAGS